MGCRLSGAIHLCLVWVATDSTLNMVVIGHHHRELFSPTEADDVIMWQGEVAAVGGKFGLLLRRAGKKNDPLGYCLVQAPLEKVV